MLPRRRGPGPGSLPHARVSHRQAVPSALAECYMSITSQVTKKLRRRKEEKDGASEEAHGQTPLGLVPWKSSAPALRGTAGAGH